MGVSPGSLSRTALLRRDNNVGAVLVHGQSIAQLSSQAPDGGEFVELVPVDGDYHLPAYSSVATVVRLGQEIGVPTDLWPIYYGIGARDIPLEEVAQKCADLRSILTLLSAETIRLHWLLQRIWE